MGHHHENEEILLRNLIYLMDMGSYDGHNTLNIYSLNLKISVYLNNVQQNMVQAIFSIEHPEFEEEIIESVAGAGENTKRALESAANNFYESIMIPLLAGLNGVDSEKVEVLLQKKSVAGAGENTKRALESAANNFYESIMIPLLAGLNGVDSEKVEVLLQKKLHILKKYESDIVCVGKRESMYTHRESLYDRIKDKLPQYIGTKKVYMIKIFASFSIDKYICEVRLNGVLIPAESLYDRIKDKLPQYIGTKKVYMIKIFASFSIDKYICEVRLNGVLIPALTEIIEEYARGWENIGSYYTEKQCVFFVQDDTTYEICPYSRKEAIDGALKFIKLFESGKEYEAIYEDRESFAKTKDLVAELFFLIPEIYCEVIINNVKYSDIVVIMKESGEVESVHTSQMRVYNYIKEAIYTHLDREHPSDEKIFNVISLSARYLSISSALEKGEEELENLNSAYLTIPVDKNYKLF